MLPEASIRNFATHSFFHGVDKNTKSNRAIMYHEKKQNQVRECCLLLKMTTPMSNVFLVANIVRFAANTLQEILSLRLVNRSHKDAIDREVCDTWNRILTEQNIIIAIRGGDMYVSSMIIQARNWYNEEDNYKKLKPANSPPHSTRTSVPVTIVMDYLSPLGGCEFYEIVELFAQQQWIDIDKLLQYSCVHGRYNEIRLLLRKGADPNKDNLAVVNLTEPGNMIKYGNDINRTIIMILERLTVDNLHPKLMINVSQTERLNSVLKHLIKREIHLRHEGLASIALSHISTHHMHYYVLNIIDLLKIGADPDYRESIGGPRTFTYIMEKIDNIDDKQTRLEIVSLLLRNNANLTEQDFVMHVIGEKVNVLTHTNTTDICITQMIINEAVRRGINLLEEKTSSGHTALEISCTAMDNMKFELLLMNGATPVVSERFRIMTGVVKLGILERYVKQSRGELLDIEVDNTIEEFRDISSSDESLRRWFNQSPLSGGLMCPSIYVLRKIGEMFGIQLPAIASIFSLLDILVDNRRAIVT